MRRYIAVSIALLLGAVSVCAASDTDERIAELSRRYLGGPAAQSSPAERAVSDDAAIRSGDWTLLAKKYPLSFISGDQREVPTPELLASWWSALGDDTLDELILMALSRNRTVEAARGALTEARAALGISRSALHPWLDSNGAWTNGDPSDNSTQQGASYNLYRIGIDASWEIDIFGGRHEQVRASEAELAAAYLRLHSAWVSLAAEVALNYIDLCALHERCRIANENLRIQNETHDMLESQFESGLADALALSQSTYTLEQTAASIPPIEAAIEGTMNRLAILVGEVPGSLAERLREPRPIPSPDPIDLVGIPAEGLRRRPDIAAAEWAFIAQQARTRSARADLYPKFSLIGSIGLESLSSGSLFEGSSFGLSIGPRITWPIFHGGAIRRNIQVQSAREEQLMAAYEGTVLAAVAEVRDALTQHEQLTIRKAALERGVEAARTALEIARDKYSNGLSDFNNVIGAQAALLSMQDQAIVCDGQLTTSIITLFKALGGGWAPIDEEIKNNN